jgi:hypothetical protein
MEWASIFSFLRLAVTPMVACASWFWRARQERNFVRVALVAEVTALRDIARARDYIHQLLDAADTLRKLDKTDRPSISFDVAVPDHYCRVYVAHIGSIGMLRPEDARLIVKFYQYADSVVTDISKGGALHQGSDDPNSFEENAQILLLAMAAADELERRNR